MESRQLRRGWRRHSSRTRRSILIGTVGALCVALFRWHTGCPSGDAAVLARHRIVSRNKTDSFEVRVPAGQHTQSYSTAQYLHVNLVQVFSEPSWWPWRHSRLLMPFTTRELQIPLMEWLNETGRSSPLVRMRPCSQSFATHLHVALENPSKPLELGEMSFRGISSTIDFPHGAVVLRYNIEVVPADLGPLGVASVLRFTCLTIPLGLHHVLLGIPVLAGLWTRVLPFRVILLRFLLPFLYPTVLWTSGSPVLLLAACFMLSFALTGVRHLALSLCWIPLVNFSLRCRRLWRLRAMRCRATSVERAFCQDEPCCICLADLRPHDESLLVLMPCRHVVHDECYTDWIRAASYPSDHFLCPMCGRQANGVGRLEAPSGSVP
eukprot:TRINITY_DN74100_c0_g1_i1.p1 TRINITY_DN74100_c0_g1~~TRINITY_DN74100_c0_g1_i1.p1  ORF type:complete len:379 (+),score=3.91 TRINITY_DN74100_c0_g1_i1:158-1294(+)